MHRLSPLRNGIVLAFPMLLAGGCITDSCGCSPVTFLASMTVNGTVRDAEGSVVHGARVKVEELWDHTCASAASTPRLLLRTDSEGEFSQRLAWSDGDRCFRIWAESSKWGPGPASDTQHVQVSWDDPTRTATPNSVNLTLALRAATIP